LQGKLGRVLLEYVDLARLPTIRTVLPALFPETAMVRDALSKDCLWLLFQRRHLLVHRRGIVDAQYAGLTGDTTPIGARVVVTPAFLDECLAVVRDVGSAVAAASACST